MPDQRPANPSKARRRRPAQSRSQATVEAIIEAAARILVTDPAGFTTAAVAERAGVSIGSLYAYFPHRDSIADEVAERLLAADEAALLAAARAPDPIPALVAALVDRHLADRALRRAVLGRQVAAGLAQAHEARAEAAIRDIAQSLPRSMSADPIVYLVATRAVLGVCRALTLSADPPPRDAVIPILVQMVGCLLGHAGDATRQAADLPR